VFFWSVSCVAVIYFKEEIVVLQRMFSSVVCCALIGLGTTANASVQVHPSSGIGAGALPQYATTYFNFNDLSIGAPAVITAQASNGNPSGTMTVTLDPNARVANASIPSIAATPVLSGSNGVGFGDPSGDQANGANTTPYLSTGSFGSVTLEFAASTYFGILWGSVDSYNDIAFYDAVGNLIGSVISGNDAFSPAVGNQGVNGTAYVNFVSDVPFTSVVLTSNGSFAFEFDNVAIGNVPEPATIAVWSILGLLGFAASRKLVK
jgi:hypothetical protein